MTGEKQADDMSSRLAGGPAKRRRSDRSVPNNEPQIGRALKSVYDQTVDEAIPDDLLDLLGRLG